MNRFKPQRGQSLLEMIFAIGIMLVVISAVLALSNSGIVGQKNSELQVVANNLAREGIEVARNIRDSNWLVASNRLWDDGLVPPAPGKMAIASFDPAQNAWAMSFIDNCAGGGGTLYPDSTGLLTHNPQSNGLPNTPSIFSRCLVIQSICQSTDGAESIRDSCEAAELKVGIKVASTVNWIERGQNHSVTLEDLLYAWK